MSLQGNTYNPGSTGICPRLSNGLYTLSDFKSPKEVTNTITGGSTVIVTQFLKIQPFENDATKLKAGFAKLDMTNTSTAAFTLQSTEVNTSGQLACTFKATTTKTPSSPTQLPGIAINFSTFDGDNMPGASNVTIYLFNIT